MKNIIKYFSKNLRFGFLLLIIISFLVLPALAQDSPNLTPTPEVISPEVLSTTAEPTVEPTVTLVPTVEPTVEPTTQPTSEPSATITLPPVPTPTSSADSSSKVLTTEEALAKEDLTPTTTSFPTAVVLNAANGDEVLTVEVIKTDGAYIDPLLAPATWTDKADYAPTEKVIVYGKNFTTDYNYTIVISSNDPPAVTHTGNVLALNDGTFTYEYQLDGTYRPLYNVYIKDRSGNVVATMSFTDAPVPSNVQLYQWETLPSGGWITGNLGSHNSNYSEGEIVPFRLDVSGLATSGNPYTFSVCRDVTNGTKKGYTTLQLFNTSRLASAGGSFTTLGAFSGVNVTINSATDVGQGVCGSGQIETQVLFDSTNNSIQFVLWGGRLASPADSGVGTGNGAASFPGSSLHLSLSSPSRDRSINPSAIIKLAQITVRKIIDSGEATPDQWCFTINPDQYNASPNCIDSGTKSVTFAGLFTGSFQITESSLNGYEFVSGTGSNCTFNGSIATASVTSAENAVNATCIFHNTESKGTLIVKKIINNDNGGTKTYSDFSFSVNGGNAVTFEADGQNDMIVNTGYYTVTERVVTGYETSYDNCTDVNVPTGGTATCTITNDDIAPTLALVKTVENNYGGTAIASDFRAKIDGNNVDWEDPQTLSAGNYTASEDIVTGYSAGDWGGDCAFDGTITLSVGDEKTCSITNSDIQPKLTITKVVIDDNGGTKEVSDFPLFVDQTSVVSGVENGFNVGEYIVNETENAGYTAVISGDCDENGNVSLAVGDVKSCTITNDDIQPKLIVIKHVINNNGGTAVAGNFTMNVTGTNPDQSSFSGEESPGITVMLDAGSYTADETALTGYAKTLDSDCTGTIDIGETKTCTITNDDISPKLTIVKDADPNDTQDFGFIGNLGTFTLDDDEGVQEPSGTDYPQSKLFDNILADYNYTITEGENAYWLLKEITCVDTNTKEQYSALVIGTSLTISLPLDSDITCTFTNTKLGPTRTQGFWKTHTAYTTSKFGAFGGTMKLGVGPYQPIDTIGKLFGNYYASIPNLYSTTKGKPNKRLAIDQARLQLAHQLITAKLNCKAFGCAADIITLINSADADYSGENKTLILSLAGQLDIYNNSGDTIIISGTPGKATPKASQTIANISYWDTMFH